MRAPLEPAGSLADSYLSYLLNTIPATVSITNPAEVPAIAASRTLPFGFDLFKSTPLEVRSGART